MAVEREEFTEVVQIKPEHKRIAIFYDDVGMAYDYCDFLNDKYVDKNVNEEWGKIDRLKRIEHHENQLKLLRSDNRLHFNEHGNEVLD